MTYLTNKEVRDDGCPTCQRIKSSKNGMYISGHPEEVPFMCEEHYRWIKDWHDKEVKLGLITPWPITSPNE